MWWRLRRKNAAPILPTSARDCSSAEDASKPCHTSNSSQTLKGSTNIVETLAQASCNCSSAEDAPEPFSASNSSQNPRGPTDRVETLAQSSSRPSSSAFRRRASSLPLSPKDALEPFCASNSGQKPRGPVDRVETLAQSSRPFSSAFRRRAISLHSSPKYAPELLYTSYPSQKINASTCIRLTNSRLEVLNVTFDSLWAPNNADEVDSYKEFFRQGRVYLIGTTHFDKDCFADVRRAIRRIRPDVVMVELCEYRERFLYDDDIDCEMRAARLECENLPKCRLVLGDRDIRITDKRANMTDFRELCVDICWDAKYVLLLMLADGGRLFCALSGPFIHHELKRRVSEAVHSQIRTQVLTKRRKANLTERDLYMTAVLHDELEFMTQKKFRAARLKSSTRVHVDPEPVRIVAVVGAAHVDGIKASWGQRVEAEVIEELMTIPRDEWSKWIPFMTGALLAVVVTVFTVYWAVSGASFTKISR